IQYGVRGMILIAQSEAFKQENVSLVGSEMDEAHASIYLVHPGADEKYYNLGDMYWRTSIEKDIAIYKKSLADASLHVPLDEIKVDKTLCFVEEPIENSDREVKRLKCSRMVVVKVLMRLLDDGRGSGSWMFLFVWNGYVAMRTLLWAGKVVSNSHQLRTKIFPLLLADDAKQWLINEEEGKITIWEELVEKFLCRFYLESYDGEDEILNEGENWGIDPLESLSNITTSFKNHKKVDGRTQKVIFHSRMNGNWNKRYVDNSIPSNNELKESKYENPPNTATDSFFKAYEARDIEKQCQTKRKYSNTSNSINEQPNKRRCKAEKFEAIQYSLGPNEEYIAIRSYEYDIWERNEDNMSNIYQDIFQKKDEGWKVTRTKK
ncbi:hypothetical protein Tco_1061758, partial [Tanacetum coccineum]